MNRYDAAAARAYFDNRLGAVIARGVQVAALSTKFGLALLSDYIGGKLDMLCSQTISAGSSMRMPSNERWNCQIC